MSAYDIKREQVYAMVVRPFDTGISYEKTIPFPVGFLSFTDKFTWDILSGNVVPVVAATEGFSAHAAVNDIPADMHYPPLIQDVFNFSVNLFDGTDPINSTGRSGGGEIRLADPNGSLDYIHEYKWDGREIEIWRAHRNNIEKSGNQFELCVVMTSAGLRWNTTEKQILIRDRSERPFTSLLMSSFYTGNGGIDGDLSVQGRAKLQSYGYVFNVLPLLIDAANNVYQWHDRKVAALDELRDGGSVLTDDGDVPSYIDLISATIPPGHYMTCNAMGIFRLNNVPAFSLRLDGRGDAEPNFAHERAGIARRILTTRGGIVFRNEEIDLTSFLDLATLQPQNVGYHVMEQKSIGDFMDEWMAGCAGFWYIELDGKVKLGLLEDPAETADIEIHFPQDILPGAEPQMIERGVPRLRTRIGWQRNWGPQAVSELSGQGAANQRLYGEPWSFADAATESVRVSYPKAREVFVPAYYANQEDASAEAIRQQGILNEDVELWRFPVRFDPFFQLLAKTVSVLDFNRYGFGAERFFRCVGVEARADGLGCNLLLLGKGV